MITYTLKIAEIRKETEDTVTLAFKQPGLKKIRYNAGQYLTLIFRINGRRYIRPYSFSSAPGIDSLLEITVKRIPGGIVSNHICDVVREGDMIEVMEPLGDFTANEHLLKNRSNIILWGAGSGITPLFSIAKYVLALQATHHVTLVYGNRNTESVIFNNKIRELQDKYKNTFSVWHFHTQLTVQETQPFLVQGRIQPAKVLEVIKAEKELSDAAHFICGPAGLKESVKEALQMYNILQADIYSEDFELVKNEKDFEEVVTQTIRIIKDGTSHAVEVAKGKSILEAGLDALLELPYSCQTGNCSVCRGILLEGKVKQLIKKHTDLKENEYQLCCTYPLSGDVKVTI
jgi:ring-1,2-phenylacetyl-CoA epoxidase subunit PaaE